MSSMVDQEDSQSMTTTQKVSIKDRLSHFTWSWFEGTISTGAKGLSSHRSPRTKSQEDGDTLGTLIGKIMSRLYLGIAKVRRICNVFSNRPTMSANIDSRGRPSVLDRADQVSFFKET